MEKIRKFYEVSERPGAIDRQVPEQHGEIQEGPGSFGPDYINELRSIKKTISLLSKRCLHPISLTKNLPSSAQAGQN